MDGDNKKSHKYKWIVWTVAIMIIVLALMALILWNPVIGLFAMLLVLLTMFVSCVLRKYFSSPDQDNYKDFVKPLSKRQAEGSQKLLRYATAVLSFLSLITTASGMRSFVFSTDWMAYLGSFAVQSILVVFSLLLCRFFVQLTVLSWPPYVKELAKGLMVGFFCVALIVSSTFSFSYIANNAYSDTCLNDYEMTIHNFLLREALSLQTENNRRGEKILNEINSMAENKLKSTITAIEDEKEKKLNQELESLVQGISVEKITQEQIDIDKDAWIKAFPAYANDIEYLFGEYEGYIKPEFESQIDVYNASVDKVVEWQAGNADASQIKDASEKLIKNIQGAVLKLESLSQNIDQWKTYGQDVDSGSYRSKLKQACNNLKIDCERLEDEIKKIEQKAMEIVQSTETGTYEELDDILSDIYLLGADEEIHTEDLIKKINNLTIEGSNNNALSSNEILNLVSLKDTLLLYEDYLQLQTNLDMFIEEQKVIYQIDIGNDEDKKAWMNSRNRDFNSFCIYINELPDMSVYMDSYEATEFEDVLEKAFIMQRDLLGNLTDFEKAFNFFNYGFPMMAYFSAFVAVFFDLGAFFTGCFLYIAEYFDVIEENSDKHANVQIENNEQLSSKDGQETEVIDMHEI